MRTTDQCLIGGYPLTVHTLAILVVVLHVLVGTIHADEAVEDIELNVEKISALGNTDVLLSTISRLALALNKCGVDVRGLKELQRVMLPSTSAKCMDGTPAGYYIRRKSGSKRWLLFLDGGYYCIDKRSCRTRAENTPNLTSSMYWPLTRDGSGILSWNPEENPFLFSANVVYIPYCSSDAWSGDNVKNNLYFMGAKIITEVINDLYKYGLKDAKKLFLAGSSAGATGVLLNIDRIADKLADEAPGLEVYGIADSGWFLDTEQFHKTECTNTFNCPPAEAVRKGFRLWKPDIPKRCRRAYPSEPWRCFFGYRMYPFVKSPLFVIAYLYDQAQIVASMGGGLSSYHQVQQDNYAKRNTERVAYMRELARLMNHTLSNVSAVFAPSCMDHEILTRSMWHSISIHGVTLIEALKCWEGSQETTNRPGQSEVPPYDWPTINLPTNIDDDDDSDDKSDSNNGALHSSNNLIRHINNKISREERRRIRKQRRRRKKKRQRMLKKRRRRIIRSAASPDDFLANALQSNSLKAYASQRQSQCIYRLYDYCTTPNCNLRCPTYMSLFSESGSSSNNRNYPDGSSNSNNLLSNDDIADIENNVSDRKKLEEIITRQK